MLQYLIVCPLMFLAWFVDSMAGGGGLISLPAYLIAGAPAQFALGTNKLDSAMGMSISTVKELKLKKINNCSVPSQFRAKVRPKLTPPMDFCLSAPSYVTVSAASAQTY